VIDDQINPFLDNFRALFSWCHFGWITTQYHGKLLQLEGIIYFVGSPSDCHAGG